MNNPIEYIEKCTLEDLLKFREGTVSIEGVNSTRWEDLVYIAYEFIGYAEWKIAKDFNISEATIRVQLRRTRERYNISSDKIDDLMREICYWKYKQLGLSTNKEIIQYTIEGKEVERYKNIKQASELTGFHKSGIGNCINGRQQTANNYKWKLANE